MKNLKFKAWIISQKRMIDVYGFNQNFVFAKDYNSPENGENIIEINDCVLLQFTGFKDIDGNDIYEGYIIGFTAVRDGTQKKRFEIYFENKCGSYWCKNGQELCNVLNEQNNDDWKRSQNWDIIDCQYVRIIGNIYQNPELLK